MAGHNTKPKTESGFGTRKTIQAQKKKNKPSAKKREEKRKDKQVGR